MERFTRRNADNLVRRYLKLTRTNGFEAAVRRESRQLALWLQEDTDARLAQLEQARADFVSFLWDSDALEQRLWFLQVHPALCATARTLRVGGTGVLPPALVGPVPRGDGTEARVALEGAPDDAPPSPEEQAEDDTRDTEEVLAELNDLARTWVTEDYASFDVERRTAVMTAVSLAPPAEMDRAYRVALASTFTPTVALKEACDGTVALLSARRMNEALRAMVETE